MKLVNQPWLLALLFIYFLGSCNDGAPGKEQDQPQIAPPNIIFILVDDMGWGDLGSFWQNSRQEEDIRAEPWQFTPALDELASRGVMLTSHYCAAPVCAPSRASLLLGVSQGHANVRNNQFDKALQDTYTLGSVLQQAGYHTAAIGKWGLQGRTEPPDWPAHPLNRGFDYYLGYVRHRDGHEHYPKEGIYRGQKEVWENRNDISQDLDKCFTTDLWTAAAKKYIVDRTVGSEADQPFFLYLAYDVPHAVLELPTQQYPEGGGLNGGLQWTGEKGKMINTASGEVDSFIHPDYLNMTYDHDRNPSTAEITWPETYQRYASLCRRIDEGIGDLMQLLEDLNISENTLVVFSSDNGPSRESYLPEEYVTNEPTFFNSFGPFDGIKRDLWEGGVRVPTIACWPHRFPAGTITDEPTAQYDWLPTFLEATGLPIPARIDGISLIPLLSGDQHRLPERSIYIEYENNQQTPDYPEFYRTHRNRTRNQMQKIRMGDFVGVRYNIQSADDDFEIYNVITDRQEADNLADKSAFRDLQKTMKQEVLRMRIPDADAPRPYDSVLISGIETPLIRTGLECAVFEGDFPWLANPLDQTPAKSGYLHRIDATVLEGKPGLVRYQGYILVPEDGRYRFSLQGSGPLLMRVHEILVIDGSHNQSAGQPLEGELPLKAGFHPISLYFLQQTDSIAPKLSLQWQQPEGRLEKIAVHYLFH